MSRTRQHSKVAVATWRSSRWLAAAGLLLTLPGCATLQEIAALRLVEFQFDRVSDVTIAGVLINESTRFSNLRAADVTRITAAALAGEVPIGLTAHVEARNPAENRVSARLVDAAWTFFVEDRRILSGQLDAARVIPPGDSVDVPLGVRFDLMELSQGGARDLFDVALAISGYGGTMRELRLELIPTIETSLGPIRYPAPIVVRRPAG